MKVLLKVGYQTILLPNDAGLQTILRTLAKGVECHDRRYCDGGIEVGKPLRVEMEMVPADTEFVVKPDADDAMARPVSVFTVEKQRRLRGQATPRLNFEARQ